MGKTADNMLIPPPPPPPLGSNWKGCMRWSFRSAPLLCSLPPSGPALTSHTLLQCAFLTDIGTRYVVSYCSPST
eukprot:1208536-Rhodomonas_salina.1